MEREGRLVVRCQWERARCTKPVFSSFLLCIFSNHINKWPTHVHIFRTLFAYLRHSTQSTHIHLHLLFVLNKIYTLIHMCSHQITQCKPLHSFTSILFAFMLYIVSFFGMELRESRPLEGVSVSATIKKIWVDEDTKRKRRRTYRIETPTLGRDEEIAKSRIEMPDPNNRREEKRREEKRREEKRREEKRREEKRREEKRREEKRREEKRREEKRREEKRREEKRRWYGTIVSKHQTQTAWFEDKRERLKNNI